MAVCFKGGVAGADAKQKQKMSSLNINLNLHKLAPRTGDTVNSDEGEFFDCWGWDTNQDISWPVKWTILTYYIMELCAYLVCVRWVCVIWCATRSLPHNVQPEDFFWWVDRIVDEFYLLLGIMCNNQRGGQCSFIGWAKCKMFRKTDGAGRGATYTGRSNLAIFLHLNHLW